MPPKKAKATGATEKAGPTLAEVLGPMVWTEAEPAAPKLEPRVIPLTCADEEIEKECARLLAAHGEKFTAMLPPLVGGAISWAAVAKMRGVLEPKG